MLESSKCRSSGGIGVSFHFHTQKTPKPVTAPKEDNVRWTGTKNAVAVETLFVGLLHNMQNYGAVQRPLEKWW
jgi:hypothetical protein